MELFFAIMSHTFAVAGLVMLITVIATLIADYVKNGAGIREIRATLRRDGASVILALLIVYALCFLAVNGVNLGLYLIHPHA